MDHPSVPTEDQPLSIAVLIPCYNEALTVGHVVKSFKAVLPNATVIVYDNNSSDDTITQARAAGAEVYAEPMQGKGNVVRRMFRDINADFYIMVDGDNTYDPAAAPAMLELALSQRLDLVNCVRNSTKIGAYRPGHRFGNLLLTSMVKFIFGNRVHDMLSGYKLLSRRFVKSFPALAGGFDIETEITIHALELALPIGHINGTYDERPAGSVSKLNTYRDGFRILWLIGVLIKHERPIQVFSAVAAMLALAAVVLGIPVVSQYFATGLVPRLPTAVLATGLISLAALSFATGLILDTVTRGRREARMLAYLKFEFLRHSGK
ncbi:MAG: glycosyltransferase family 2 protein [Acidocella sp.]|nr:glycosyltransferase family 2 protein [Acidocella sp.]